MINLLNILNAADKPAAIQENFDRIAASNALGTTIIKVDDEDAWHRIGLQRVEGALQIYVVDEPVLVSEEPPTVIIKVDGEETLHRVGLQRVDGALQLYISDEPV